MDQELQKYYETYFELFSLPGWKQLMEEVTESISRLEQSTLDQSSEEVFHYNRGFVGALKYLTSLEIVTQTVHDELLEDEQDASV